MAFSAEPTAAGTPPAALPHVATDADRGFLDALFLGPYGENDALLEKLVVEFLRDHVYWRRNFHPADPPAIPTSAADSACSSRRMRASKARYSGCCAARVEIAGGSSGWKLRRQ